MIFVSLNNMCLKYFRYNILMLFLILGFFLFPTFTYAKKTLNDAAPALSTVSGKTGVTEGDVSNIVGDVVKAGLYIAGLLFFVLMVYAGLVWMTARGNEERTTKAKNTMIAAVIGVVILVSSYALTTFIQTKVIKGNAGAGASIVGQNQTGNEPLGCCLDWVGSGGCSSENPAGCAGGNSAGNIYIPAARWTTYEDCKLFGEEDTETDHGGPEGEGSWLWYSSEAGDTWDKCETRQDSYGVAGENY